MILYFEIISLFSIVFFFHLLFVFGYCGYVYICALVLAICMYLCYSIYVFCSFLCFLCVFVFVFVFTVFSFLFISVIHSIHQPTHYYWSLISGEFCFSLFYFYFFTMRIMFSLSVGVYNLKFLIFFICLSIWLCLSLS